MEYHVAATDQEVPKGNFPGNFRPRTGLLQQPSTPAPAPAAAAPRDPVPRGVTHAVRSGDRETVCGLPLASLFDFPDREWPPPSHIDRCLICRQWVKAEAAGN
jgi:hypothetical protein